MKLKIHISIIPHNAYFNYRHTTLNLSNLQDIFDISQKKEVSAPMPETSLYLKSL